MVYHTWTSSLYFWIYKKCRFALGGKGLKTLIACYHLVSPNCYNIMKEGYYRLILLLPIFLILVVLMAPIVVMIFKRKLSYPCFVAINAFSSMIKEKNDINEGKPRWLFKKVNLTGEKKILSTVFIGLFLLFAALLMTAFSIFWFLLLMEISHTCDQDDTKDCFEYKVIRTEEYVR